MRFMFPECYELKEIKGISNFDASKVVDMSAMIQECHELEYLDLTNFNTSNVKVMSYMFNKCYKFKKIKKGINNFNTGNVNKMYAMFQECRNLQYLDLSNFNTSNLLVWYICSINVLI